MQWRDRRIFFFERGKLGIDTNFGLRGEERWKRDKNMKITETCPVQVSDAWFCPTGKRGKEIDLFLCFNSFSLFFFTNIPSPSHLEVWIMFLVLVKIYVALQNKKFYDTYLPYNMSTLDIRIVQNTYSVSKFFFFFRKFEKLG